MASQVSSIICLEKNWHLSFSNSSRNIVERGALLNSFYRATISPSLLKLRSIESVMPSKHLILCLPLLPSIFPSSRVFSNESALRFRWPKFWSLSISPSSEYSGLISFRIDWVDLLAVQGTLKSLLQHYSSKASIFLSLCFPYGPSFTTVHDTGKTIALTI